jgi:tRNA(Arg) A34 adenosine deaminase TadA
MNRWDGLDPVWRRCFALAWESFRAGSVAVGAVLIDPAGDVVSTGRNRRNEPDAPPGQLCGTNLAHAEVNALVALPPGHYPDHVLYSTLEPCLLCRAALRHSHVGTVRYAAPDPLWSGLERIPELNHHFGRRWARGELALDGPLGMWAAVLPMLDMVERAIEAAMDSYTTSQPGIVALARRWAGPVAARLRTMSLDEALEYVWDDLT